MNHLEKDIKPLSWSVGRPVCNGVPVLNDVYWLHTWWIKEVKDRKTGKPQIKRRDNNQG
jgi:hypothetical protein